jgi:hypothetical protein
MQCPCEERVIETDGSVIRGVGNEGEDDERSGERRVVCGERGEREKEREREGEGSEVFFSAQTVDSYTAIRSACLSRITINPPPAGVRRRVRSHTAMGRSRGKHVTLPSCGTKLTCRAAAPRRSGASPSPAVSSASCIRRMQPYCARCAPLRKAFREVLGAQAKNERSPRRAPPPQPAGGRKGTVFGTGPHSETTEESEGCAQTQAAGLRGQQAQT